MKKKLLALAICICLIISLMPSSVFAATSYLRVRTTSDFTFNASAANLPAVWKNHQTHVVNMYYIGGSFDTAVYCIQMDVTDITTESVYNHSETHSTELSDEQLYLLSVALCMGHTGGNDNNAFQVATQLVVWIITTGAYENESALNAILNDYIVSSDVKAYAKQLWNDCMTYYTVPSFCCYVGEVRPVYDMQYDPENGYYYATLTDENGVLERYKAYDVPEGVECIIDENTLTIKSTEPLPEDAEIILENTTTNCQNRAILMYMFRQNYQEMAYNFKDKADPVQGFFKLELAESSITINKVSTDGIIEGMKFKITSLDDATMEPIILTTDKDGNTETVAIEPGNYKAEEIDVADRYVAPKHQEFVVEAGKPVTLTFTNKAHTLELTKESVDGVVEGLEFRVTCEALEYETTIKTNAEGKWEIVGLLPGTYTIEEINVPDRYFAPDPIEVVIADDSEVVPVTAVNKFKGEINKIDASYGEPVEGATIVITDKDTEETFTSVTNEDGVAQFPILPGHSYTYQETEAPEGYDLNEEIYEFTVDTNGNITGDTTMIELFTGTVVINKVNVVNGEPVPGATITVYDENMEELYKEETDAEGNLYFPSSLFMTDDAEGTLFYFEETLAPDMFYRNEDIVPFRVMPDGEIVGKTTLINAPEGTVTIFKLNEKGEPLPGATLEVYDAETDEFLFSDVTNDDGQIYFTAEGPGRFYFIEAEAPTGYLKSDEKFYFELDEDFVITGVTRLVNKVDPGPKTGVESYGKFMMMLVGYAIFMLVLAVTLKQRKAKANK